MSEEQSAFRGSYTAGLTIRRQIKTELEQVCWNASCKIEFLEDRGWFSSSVRFRITGPSHKLKPLVKKICKWLLELEG
jgi:hypothetical protein